MALKTILLALIVVMAAIMFSATLFSLAVSNGGYPETDFPLVAQANTFQQKMNTFTASVANSTSATGQTNPTVSTAEGYTIVINSGMQTVSLMFDSLGIMINMLASALLGSGVVVPAWLYPISAMFITVVVVFAILQAIMRWWI